MSELLQVADDSGGISITLARSDKRNALSAALVEEIIDVVDRAHERGVEVITFQGAGKNFSAGFDFTGWEEQSEGDLVLRFIRIEQLLQKVASSPSLTVAMAHGRNFGAGVDLFAVCRQRICTSDATFRMPGLKFGLVLGTRRFAAIVGRDRAHDILSTMRIFDAGEAKQIGFVTQVTEQDDWPSIIEDARVRSPDPSRALLHGALSDRSLGHDLEQLVHSAARPGLKQRIGSYLGQSA